ncbi:MAG: hypothetical protein MUE69_10655 [Myxococcota bacterium]|nr:hypothetical protein [Myxococcota bacterium]
MSLFAISLLACGSDSGTGGLGEVCRDDGTCVGSLLCQRGICLLPDGVACTEGDEGCTCGEGGVCNTPDLVCAEERCRSVRGGDGQNCYPNRTCNDGLRCDVEGVCVTCTVGELGCTCREGGCNGELVCQSNLCTDPVTAEREIPTAPRCYSPCRSSFTDDSGTFRACSADGLVEGCLGDLVCNQGSCVNPGERPTTCASDEGCPAHQRCIRGQCYSDCAIDADCSASERCHLNTCRTACTAEREDCPDGSFCEVVDGSRGFCMPSPAPSGEPRPFVEGSYELGPTSIELTNRAISRLVTIRNDSPRTQRFVFRKVEHIEFGDGGAVTVRGARALPFLLIGPPDAPSRVDTYQVDVPPDETREVELRVAGGDGVPPRWEGLVSVSSEWLGDRSIRLSYATTPDGRWTGRMYYFGQFGDRNLAAWAANPSSDVARNAVGNAFVRQWGQLRTGGLSLEQLSAVITATTTGSWKTEGVRRDCPFPACYPSAVGLVRYSDDLAGQPVPSAVTELPFAVDLRASDTRSYRGRIVSELALQYPGDPAFQIEFGSDPAGSTCDVRSELGCVNFLRRPADGLLSTVFVGGRYRTTESDSSCAAVPAMAADRFQHVATPWLLPGFTKETYLDEDTGLRYRYECRDPLLPFGSDDPIVNASLAAANPIPDGRARGRALELVDGFLVNQNTLYLLVRERFVASFLGATDTEGFAGYSLVVLERASAQVADADFEGNVHTDSRTSTVQLDDAIRCAPDLVRLAVGTTAVTAANAASVADTMLTGRRASGSSATYDASDVHYLCHDTGLFDQGPDLLTPRSCPAGSTVTFFASSSLPRDLSSFPCQRDGSCGARLQDLLRDERTHANPVWRCADENQVFCDANRLDLRSGKNFFMPSASPSQVLVPLVTVVDSAFRYKTRFRSRTGDNVGFAPTVCVPNSDQIPYCYDPEEIEEIESRVDCLNAVFRDHFTSLRAAGMDSRIRSFLETSYSFEEERRIDLPTPIVHDGFERSYSELMIMLGDESYTAAFQSRFDLAGSSIVSFEGALFEPDGINLSGVAGYEMHLLYQAAQYYREVLGRFYRLSPTIWRSIGSTDVGRQFISEPTVTSYFSRVLRASTQLSRAWTEVAKRYQALNRPDLARLVVERAYTSTYMESVVLARMMQRVVAVADARERASIVAEVERSFTVYRAALLDMREVYASFTDDVTYFGFAPDYIPLPALDPGDPNAFEEVFATAREAVAAAREREDLAINGNRSFETDAAAFQSELARVRTNYEGQLADLCGTFRGDDGRIYPAITQYAALSEGTRLLGDPCGLVGNGDIHEAIASLEIQDVDTLALEAREGAMQRRAEIETERASELCGIELSLASTRFETAGRVDTLEQQVRQTERSTAQFLREFERVRTIQRQARSAVSECTPTPSFPPTPPNPAKCASAVYEAIEVVGSGLVTSAVQTAAEERIARLRDQAAAIRRQSILVEGEAECAQTRANSKATLANIWLEAIQIEIDVLKLQYQLQLSLSRVRSLRNQAERLEAEREESQQLLINVEAARNDPNVRIYKNDAIINADRFFFAALRAAYRATRVFEYFTSQSYARRDQLGLIRLVSRGDYNLDTYLLDLQEAYYSFQEEFGRPDTRVDILSLRDDVLQIPYYDMDGRTLSQAQRVEQFRAALADPRLLDNRGYTTVPFATTVDRLSPLTRNHKILFVESEIIGSDVGDGVARVYLTQSGTGTIRRLTRSGEDFYQLPPRTAVLNPFTNGVRAFVPEVYRSERLRDRPFANSAWELVLNQRDELANQDIDINSLTDIRVYVYYTDHTAL